MRVGESGSSARRPARKSSVEKHAALQISFRPSPTLWAVALLLYYTRRRRLLVAVFSSWLFFKFGHAMIASPQFQCRVLLLQFTRHWPPCDLDKPSKAQPLPLLLRWIDWLPSRLGVDDIKSFPGLQRVRTVEVARKRKIGAWLIERHENASKKQRGVVLYFRGRSGHRGTRSRIRMYDRLRSEPIGLPCVTFDGDEDEFTDERSLLVCAHAVWSTITRPPYDFDTDSVVIWGSSLGCCSAANLCLYLMRRGTPPAALILENPATSFPKLIAARFEFLGEDMQAKIEHIAKTLLVHRFDLEKRIRSIYSFGLHVPVLLISAENNWTVPASHAQRLASFASALSARSVPLLSLPVTRQELISDRTFITFASTFIHQALSEAKLTQRRSFSVDFGTSPATWASDQAAEDRLFEDESADPPFGL